MHYIYFQMWSGKLWVYMFMDSLWVVGFFLLLTRDKFSPMKFKCKIIFAKYGQNNFQIWKKKKIFYQLTSTAIYYNNSKCTKYLGQLIVFCVPGHQRIAGWGWWSGCTEGRSGHNVCTVPHPPGNRCRNTERSETDTSSYLFFTDIMHIKQ